MWIAVFCVRFELIFIFSIIRHELGHDRPVSVTNYGMKTVKRKWKKEIITKYATWTVRGVAHKEKELNLCM
jgi:hypothetical protein